MEEKVFNLNLGLFIIISKLVIFIFFYQSISHQARLRSIVFSSSFNPITNQDKKLSIEVECFG